MAFAAQLGAAGHKPERIATSAKVHFNKADAGWTIERIELTTRPACRASPTRTSAIAETAKAGCPVSKALAGVEIVPSGQLG